MNRQIKADNALLRELKELVKKLVQAVKNTIPAIAATMETIRQNIIVFNYGLLSVRDKCKNTKEYIEQVTRQYSDYKDIRSQMRVKAKECSELQKELAGLSMFAAVRRKELKTKIAALSEEIAELQFEVKSVMQVFDKTDAAGMKKVEEETSKSKARIVKLDEQEANFIGTINLEKEKFDKLKTQAADLDQDELTDTRLALRPQMENEGRERIRRADGGRKISLWNFQGSISDVDKMLGEDGLTERRMKECQKPIRETRARQQER